mgnify:CR=1 FL=1
MELERIAKLEAQVDSLKEDVADVKQDIKELHSRITTGNREILEKFEEKIDALAKSDKEQHETLKKSMDNVKERVDVLEKWRWMIVGGAIEIGYLMGHLDFFAKFLK